MKIKLAALTLAALAATATSALAAPPSSKKPPKDQCFYARDVSNFAAQTDTIVNLRVGVSDVYQFQLMGPCPDIRWHERLGLVAQGSDWICSGLDAELVSPSSIGPQHCPVSKIRKLTPAEIAALPKGAKP
ncbi:MAG: hypothetical protein JWQ97_1725 [Phenylobacterium sp.]|nr:hypothetical protein [Phenylobacterium sp.]